MTDNPGSDFFISDVEDGVSGDTPRIERIVVPAGDSAALEPPDQPLAAEPIAPSIQQIAQPVVQPPSVPEPRLEQGSPQAPLAPVDPLAPTMAAPPQAAPEPVPTVVAQDTGASSAVYAEPELASEPEPAPAPEQVGPSREQRLAAALDSLMQESPEIEAAALVSLDGFTMASALPEGMQEDRVGAMSAAILGLGERAAAELGRGRLSQVFIQGAEGYVMLTAAGTRAVLTCLAGEGAKLGLIIYDMRGAADEIGEILG